MYALVFYSHTDYQDVWPLLFQQTEKYIQNKNIYFLVNNPTQLIPKSWNVILYDDKLNYQNRVSSCLEKINEEIVIFHHEDMILYDEPNQKLLENLSELVASSEIDILKLIRAQYNDAVLESTEQENIYINPDNLLFAIQPSICKTSKLVEIYKNTPGKTIWEFEELSNRTVRAKKIKSCCYYTGEEKKRGLFHWDSLVYPYFATAVVKGKWNFSDYMQTLKPLLKKAKVDINIRGAA